uniref:Centrosomin N-terminal motif 1 domain-containing protein n=1 Tax=Cyprinus carpio TaxID=7962 RepID=A0A8C2GH80_CYPCA
MTAGASDRWCIYRCCSQGREAHRDASVEFRVSYVTHPAFRWTAAVGHKTGFSGLSEPIIIRNSVSERGLCDVCEWHDLNTHTHTHTLPPDMSNTYRTLSQHLNDLKKENFSLKLRIYFLEERIQQKFEDSSDEIYRTIRGSV